MKVKEVIISALNILGRTDISRLLESGENTDAEQAEAVNTLLYCFNAAEDEVARRYVPLTASENKLSPDGYYYYTSFTHTPVRIKRVTSNGADVEFEASDKYLKTNCNSVTVEYEYSPAKKGIDDDSDFGYEVGRQLLAYGCVSEYCLINGEVEAAEIWEGKYRKSIDAVQSKLPSCGRIPPRRWV